jgi:hypothetical protein
MAMPMGQCLLPECSGVLNREKLAGPVQCAEFLVILWEGRASVFALWLDARINIVPAVRSRICGLGIFLLQGNDFFQGVAEIARMISRATRPHVLLPLLLKI